MLQGVTVEGLAVRGEGCDQNDQQKNRPLPKPTPAKPCRRPPPPRLHPDNPPPHHGGRVSLSRPIFRRASTPCLGGVSTLWWWSRSASLGSWTGLKSPWRVRCPAPSRRAPPWA